MRPLRSGVARNSFILSTTYTPSEGTIIRCDNYDYLVFHIGYTRGGAGGGLNYKVEFSIDQVKWAQGSFISPQALVAGSDLVNFTQRVEQKYVATGASEEIFTTHSYVVSGPFARILLIETGNVGAPGTAHVDFFLNGVK